MDSALDEDQSSHQQDQDYCYDDDEDNHDSDVEARLYAEIYYSNNINENDTVAELAEDNNVATQSSNTTYAAVNQSGSINHNSKGLQNLSGDNLNSLSNVQLPTVNNTDKDVCSTSTLQENVIVSSNDPDSVQIIQDKNVLAGPKRSLEYDSRCNPKRRKQENDCSSSVTQCQQSDAQNALVNSTNCQKNTTVNSNDKQVSSSTVNGIKLLSPQFYDLFFSKKSKNSKKVDIASNKKSTERCINNKSPKKNNFEPSSSKQKTNSSKQKSAISEEDRTNKNLSNNSSEIIDICSESSEESSNEKSKFDIVEKTKKKFKKSFDCNKDNNKDLSDSSSDSDESIFEVPLPPKPVPVLIDLKDSDSDSESNSDNDDCTNDLSICQIDLTQNDDEESRNKNTHDNSKKNEETSFILNCTEVQKGAHNLQEIRTMSREKSNTNAQTNQTDNNQQNISNIQSTSQHCNDMSKGNKKNKRSRLSNPENCSTSTNSDKQSLVEISQNKESALPADYFFRPMSKTMKDFYDKSWGGESFDTEKLKSTMTSDPRKWAILDEDIVGTFSRRSKRYFGMICNRCGRDGHRSNQCTEAYKKPTCHMCGIQGHFETSCPQKKCLTCGRMQRMYSKTCENCVKMQCSRCHSRGHLENSCPDLWRRYHDTVYSNDVQVLKNPRQVMKPSHELFCCNCAKKGHDFNSCKKLRWTQHFSTPSYVVNYDGPAYYSESLHETRIVNDQRVHENFDDSNFTNINTSNLSNTSDKPASKKLKLNPKDSPRQQRMIVENENKNIFEIKSSKIDQTTLNRSIKIDLGTCSRNNPVYLDDWQPLIRFLNALVSEVQGTFVLKQMNNKQLIFHITCSKNYTNILTKLLKQYTERNNHEKPKMFLEWDRNPNKLVDLFNNKMSEMNASNEDPLKLYEECRQLHLKFNSTDSRISAQELTRLITLEERLLVSLYKGNFADDSLKQLSRLIIKIQKSQDFNLYSEKYFKRRKRIPKQPLIKCKWLHEFLYLYNNIFTPHQPKKLATYVGKYREYISSRIKIMNDISFLTGGRNLLTSQAGIDNHHLPMDRAVASSTSQDLPMLTPRNSSSTFETTSSPIDSSMRNNLNNSSENHNPTSTKSTRKKKRTASTKEGKMDNSLKRIEILLRMARKLKAPHLSSHIENLDNKLKNNVKINPTEFIELRKLVRKERKRQNREKQR